MAKYLDLTGLTAYDAKIKNYVDGKGSMWEQVYSGTIQRGYPVMPSTIKITNSSYGVSYKIVSDMNIYLAVPETNLDTNLTATKYTLDDGNKTTITNVRTASGPVYGYKYLDTYLGPEIYVDYSKTWEDVLQAYSWAYDGAPLRKNFYASKVIASSTNTAVFLVLTTANIKVYKLKTE